MNAGPCSKTTFFSGCKGTKSAPHRVPGAPGVQGRRTAHAATRLERLQSGIKIKPFQQRHRKLLEDRPERNSWPLVVCRYRNDLAGQYIAVARAALRIG